MHIRPTSEILKGDAIASRDETLSTFVAILSRDLPPLSAITPSWTAPSSAPGRYLRNCNSKPAEAVKLLSHFEPI